MNDKSTQYFQKLSQWWGGEESFETKGLVASMTFMKTGDIFYPFNMRSNQRYLQINKVRLKNNEIDQISR